MVAGGGRAELAIFCADLKGLVRESRVSTASLIARLPYSRSQVYAILDGTIARAPDFDGFVRPVVAACSVGDRAALDRWRRRHEELEAALADAARRRPPRPARPANLPPDVARFAGRDTQLAELDAITAAAATSRVLVVVSGTAGVGKTSLAVHWAHRAADRFPDGQLYLDLRGFDAGPPEEPDAALRRLLDALRLPPERVPADAAGQSELLHATLAGRQVLLVLDNAGSADQVRPLLPRAAGCAVLVTSRKPLTGLYVREGGVAVVLDVLDDEESRRLLLRRIGRVPGPDERLAVDEIVRRCVGLPLALAVVAGRAAIRPQASLTAIAAELAAYGDDLTAFGDEDGPTDLRTVFSWSYRRLTPPAARLFRLLGHPPIDDVTPDAATSLLGMSAAHTRRLVAELVRSGLLAEADHPPRHRMHGLLRRYAAERSMLDDPAAAREAATLRLLDHYLHTAFAAGRQLDPHLDAIALDSPAAGSVRTALDDRAAALAWFATEEQNLLRLVRHAAADHPARAWRLAWTLEAFLSLRTRWTDLHAVLRVAVPAAERAADPEAVARMTGALGRVEGWRGNLDAALALLRSAAARYERLGDRRGQGHMRMHLAWVHQLGEDHAEACRQAEAALELYRAAGYRRGEAVALNEVGWSCVLLGDHGRALTFCTLALERVVDGDLAARAATLDSLGLVHRRLGDRTRATSAYQEAADLYETLTDPLQCAGTLIGLAETRHEAGDDAAARKAYERAVEHLDRLGRPAVDRVREALGRLER